MDGDQLTGQLLAQYKIEEKLGQGAMGTVFRAWDTQLRRRVAIKILEAGTDHSPEKRARFLMEARAVAALNHPNIVTIYEIGQRGDHDYIAMEFVPGRTLHAVIQDGKQLSLNTVLHYAAQIADAVSAAHAAGITHRDLKPANIMVSERDRLKVLDFGIAKRQDAADETAHTRTVDVNTQRGLAVGTPHYMSPEQAQGKRVDGRSDIFALGAILYEMLTGQRAFGGDSMAEVMVGILTLEPLPVSASRPVPVELDRLIGRCLRKDVERRLQHADDLKIALEEIRAEFADAPAYSGTEWQPATRGTAAGYSTAASSTGGRTAAAAATPQLSGSTGAVAVGQTPEPTVQRWWLAAGALVLALALAGWFFFWSKPAPKLLEGASLKRMTADAGLSAWPTLSRDGKFLAYASDRPDEKNLHIWVQQMSGGRPIQLTSGEADDFEPAFSPDGSKIAFHSDREPGGIYVVPVLGGEARLVAKQGRGPRFSPDGKKIAYWSGGDLGRIYVIDAAGGTPQQLQPDFTTARYPIWSPDGQQILFEGYLLQRGQQQSDRQTTRHWWVAPVSETRTGAKQVNLKFDAINILNAVPAAWLADDQVLFSGLQESAGSFWTLKISPRTAQVEGLPRRLTFGTNIDLHPATTGSGPDTLRVAFSSLTKRVDLWVLPIDADRGVVKGEMTRLTQGVGTQTQLSMSRDGRRIAYLSDREGKAQPWIRDLDSGRQASVASDRSLPWAPHISPDGNTLAWSLIENGRPDRTLRAAVGPEGQLGPPEPLCDQCGPVVSWHPDGRSVTYSKFVPSRTILFEIGPGKSYDVLAKPDADVWGGRFSPDSKWLAFNLTPTPVNSRLYIAPFDAGRRGPIPETEWIPVTEGAGWDDKSRWSPDSKSLYFVSQRDGFLCIWWQPLDPATRRPQGPPRAVAHFHHARLSMRNVDMGPLAFQAGPDKLVFSLGEITGNVWMLGPDQP